MIISDGRLRREETSSDDHLASVNPGVRKSWTKLSIRHRLCILCLLICKQGSCDSEKGGICSSNSFSRVAEGYEDLKENTMVK